MFFYQQLFKRCIYFLDDSKFPIKEIKSLIQYLFLVETTAFNEDAKENVAFWKTRKDNKKFLAN